MSTRRYASFFPRAKTVRWVALSPCVALHLHRGQLVLGLHDAQELSALQGRTIKWVAETPADLGVQHG